MGKALLCHDAKSDSVVSPLQPPSSQGSCTEKKDVAIQTVEVEGEAAKQEVAIKVRKQVTVSEKKDNENLGLVFALS